MPYDPGPVLEQLQRQVDLAHADVRRVESVGPATSLAVLVAILPLLLLAIAVAWQWVA